MSAREPADRLADDYFNVSIAVDSSVRSRSRPEAAAIGLDAKRAITQCRDTRMSFGPARRGIGAGAADATILRVHVTDTLYALHSGFVVEVADINTNINKHHS